MRALISDFLAGNATQRVAIVADVASLFGLSVAAVVAGLLSISGRLIIGNVVFAAVKGTLFIGALALTAALYWLARTVISRRYGSAPFPAAMLQVAIASIFLASVFTAALVFYDYLSGYRYVIGSP